MGNIVSANEDYSLIGPTEDDSILNNKIMISQFITDWALNDYDDGLRYTYNITNKDPVGEDFKNLLQKRACCTEQTKVKIALPLLNDNKLYDNFNYGTIDINIFKNSDDLKNNCTFPKNTGTSTVNTKNYYRNYLSGGKSTDVSACVALYGDTNSTSDKSFCNHVKLDRELMAKHDDFSASNESVYYKAYGKYHASPEFTNAYIDCNCKNSVLWTDKILGLLTVNKETNSDSSEYNKLFGETLTQLMDLKCSQAGNNAYKKNRADSIECLQIQNLVNNKYVNNKDINLVQSCSPTQIEKIASVPEIPEVTRQPIEIKDTQSDKVFDKVLEENKIPLILVSVFIVIVIIFLFLFRKSIF